MRATFDPEFSLYLAAFFFFTRVLSSDNWVIFTRYVSNVHVICRVNAWYKVSINSKKKLTRDGDRLVIEIVYLHPTIHRTEIMNGEGEKLRYIYIVRQRRNRITNSKDVGNGCIYHWRNDN